MRKKGRVLVVDASALIEVLLQTPDAGRVADRLTSAEALHAPHLIDLEVAQVLRRLAASGRLEPIRGSEALADLADFPLHRHGHDFLLPRIWELRGGITAYDAAYVALSEALGCPLLTRDRRLNESYSAADLV